MWASTLASAACASANRGSRRIASRKNSAAERCSVVFSRRMSCRPRRKNSCAARFSVPRRSSRAASPSSSVRRNARTVARAISSWIAKMSWSSLSNVSDQSSAPSAATSWAATRTRSPALRTLPSSTARTESSRATSRLSTARSLNWKDPERDATRNPRTPASALMISSAAPSQKYPWSRPGLMSANASTATDGSEAAASRVGDGEAIARSASASRAGGATSACGSLPVPKPHATATATKKPAITSTMMNRSAQSGRPSGTSIVETTWTSSQPAAAYASATRATRPDPSVRQRILYRDSDSPMGSHYRRRPYRGATQCVRGRRRAGPCVLRGYRPGLDHWTFDAIIPSSRPAGPGC